MPLAHGFTFGPFRLDIQAGQLFRDGAVVKIPARCVRLLHMLVAHAGEIVTKEQLAQVGWPDVAVEDNSVSQAMVRLRRTLTSADSSCAILTEHGFGYRLTGVVTRSDAPAHETDLDAILAPHRSFTEGRAALETLSRRRIADARRTFEQLLIHHPTDPRVHVGLANACALTFEASRADAVPDVDALRVAATHARDACRVNAEYGEAFATLGFVLERTGQKDDAVAALRHAVTLEPYNWRHQLRLSYGTWGNERLRAAHQVLALLPGCPMAHALAATVFVARNALGQAEREVDAGLAAAAGESDVSERFAPVALHWLKGLLCLARGETDDALAAFDRERALETGGHLYARESSANAWYAIGACRFRAGDMSEARVAFEHSLERRPNHHLAMAGLALANGTAEDLATGAAPTSVESALASAALFVAAGDVSKGVDTVTARLKCALPGSDGWLLPLEPMLQAYRVPDAWAPVLAILRGRAS